MRPYRPRTSAKIRIRIMPTNRRGLQGESRKIGACTWSDADTCNHRSFKILKSLLLGGTANTCITNDADRESSR